MDGDNPVTRLCQDGMRAEAEGRADDAYGYMKKAVGMQQAVSPKNPA